MTSVASNTSPLCATDLGDGDAFYEVDVGTDRSDEFMELFLCIGTLFSRP